MTTRLHISPDLSLPLDAVTSTQCILARKGKGKTYLAKVFAEELLEARQPVVVLDPTGAWWGIKSSANGKAAGFEVVVFGGEHADVPLEEGAGEIIAKAIVEHRFSAIIDLSLLRKGAMLRFARVFLETIYRLNRQAMHLIVDEADMFAPQRPFGEDTFVLGAMQDIVRRGRIKGIGCTMITQRPQVLNKDVLTQTDTLYAMGMSHPKDIDAVKEWVNVHAEPAQSKILIDSLPSLPVGTAWIWSPGSGVELHKVKVRELKTFNSSATPKAGEVIHAPKVLAKVDIDALGEQIASTVERAKANDPAELKRKIVTLEKEIEKRPKEGTKIVAAPAKNDEELKKCRAMANAAIALNNSLLKQRTQLSSKLAKVLNAPFDALNKAMDEVQKMIAELNNDQAPLKPVPVTSEPAAHPESRATFSNTKPAPLRPPVECSGDLKGKLRKIAQIVAAHNPQGLKRAILAAMVGMSDGGSFSARLSEVRSAGAIITEGGMVIPTSEGVEKYGGQFAMPETTEEVLKIWEHKLKPGSLHRRIIDTLIEAGKEMSVADLAAAVERTDGGSFSARLSEVRSTGLMVDTRRGHVEADREKLLL